MQAGAKCTFINTVQGVPNVAKHSEFAVQILSGNVSRDGAFDLVEIVQRSSRP
jgi:hypothetical protein